MKETKKKSRQAARYVSLSDKGSTTNEQRRGAIQLFLIGGTTTPLFAATQVQQVTHTLTALRQTVEQLTGSQEQTARGIRRLESAVAEINAKIPESPLPSIAPTPKSVPVPPSSRAR